MINKAKTMVENLMAKENSGHGMEHILRVYNLAMKFAENETCNKDIVALSAMLHDVDDYKLFGDENQHNLTNTKRILNELNIEETTKNAVLEIVSCIGYSKRLKGLTPTSIEGMIVSDADMCDAIGAVGILRTYQYNLKQGKEFFNKNIWPIENISADEYTSKREDTAICHFFEKILKLKSLMLTHAGKAEAEKRHNFVVDFLNQFFTEENAVEWQNYLKEYLTK